MPFARKESVNDEKKRGAALIVAVVFSVVIVAGIGGVLPMLVSDLKQNTRTSVQEAAFALAESGIEEAIWAVREFADSDADWIADGWSQSGDGAYWFREWNLSAEPYQLDDDRVGKFRVIVEVVGDSEIVIVSQGVVEGAKGVNDRTVSRFIEVTLDKPNPVAHGLIARDGVDFNGRPSFDSYDSRIFPYDYSAGVNSGSNVTVGSVSGSVARIDLGNSFVYGNVVTGDSGTGNPFGATITGDVVWEFDMDFPPVTVPDTTGYRTTFP